MRRHRTLLAAAGVSACIAYGGFLQWLNAPSSLFRSVTTAALVVLGVIALWTGFWSLTTKLNHGSWHVRVHLTIASIGAAFCAWGWWVTGLVAFATQWSVLVQIGVAVMAATALVALYLHLREATYYGRRVSLALACVATLVIGAIAWIIAVGVDDGNVNRVDLGPDVRLDGGDASCRTGISPTIWPRSTSCSGPPAGSARNRCSTSRSPTPTTDSCRG